MRARITKQELVLIVLGVLLVFGIIFSDTSLVDAPTTSPSAERWKPPESRPAAYLVAPINPLSMRTQVNTKMFHKVHWPANLIPEDPVWNAEELNGLYVNVNLPSNTPVSRKDFVSEDPIYNYKKGSLE